MNQLIQDGADALAAAHQRINALEAEISLLGKGRKELCDCINELEAEISILKAENARLRAALNKIACWNEGPEVHGGFDSPGNARIAREALGNPFATAVIHQDANLPPIPAKYQTYPDGTLVYPELTPVMPAPNIPPDLEPQTSLSADEIARRNAERPQ